jgi:hypothetical protein
MHIHILGYMRSTFTYFTPFYLFFGCFDMDPKHRNEPKQTEKIIYWFRETNRK